VQAIILVLILLLSLIWIFAPRLFWCMLTRGNAPEPETWFNWRLLGFVFLALTMLTVFFTSPMGFNLLLRFS